VLRDPTEHNLSNDSENKIIEVHVDVAELSFRMVDAKNSGIKVAVMMDSRLTVTHTG
jgi:hypothetical protein